ncbi:MAG: NAD(P) transhydrogenase subunit alpha [Candidatus Porifericomitaceae bacterium WSBS_2022_MAG_OTU9]
MLKIGVPVERDQDERRVALVPDVAKRLGAGERMTVLVETGAGDVADYSDSMYKQSGCEIVSGDEMLHQADLVLRVSPPAVDKIKQHREGTMLAGFMGSCDGAMLAAMQERKLTVLSLERMPRSTRAQAMDALSSQRSVAGYHAVLVATANYGRFLPMLTGPTGTVRPATILIIGAGVAGLQAIATARRLGAIVEVSDIRAAAKEQVESLGARFVGSEINAEAAGGYARELNDQEKKAQAEQLAKHIAKANILITTAEIPNRPAPRIVSTAMIEAMSPGSLVLDLAAASGGNCEPMKLGETVDIGGVKVMGPRNMAAGMPAQASDLLARNFMNLIGLLVAEAEEGAGAKLAPDWQDDILAAVCVTRADSQDASPQA